MATGMKAAVVRAFGAPLDVCEVDKPEVAPGKILVRIAAARRWARHRSREGRL